MEQRDYLIAQRRRQAQEIAQSASESLEEESPVTSEDDADAYTTSAVTGEPTLLELLKSIPATQETHLEDDVFHDETYLHCMYSSTLLPRYQCDLMPISADNTTTPPHARTVSLPPQPPVASQEPRSTPPLPDAELGVSPLPVESASARAMMSPIPSVGALGEQELREWTVSLWPKEVHELKSFRLKSWGTAYQAIAEVQVLLRLGKTYRVTVNLPLHSVSMGHYFDRDGKEKAIEFRLLGSYMNGQSPGTWGNKLTLFFAIYHFLARTEGMEAESLDAELRTARQAMLSWGIGVEPPESFLPIADARTTYRITPLRNMIREYMVRSQMAPHPCIH
jgi:hypothetical protein